MESSSLKSKQYIVLICGCQKYISSLQSAMQRMSNESYTVIGLVGTDTPTHFDGAILHICADDTYEGLPKKIQAAIRWIYDNMPDVCGIFKTDDDIYFNDHTHLANEIHVHSDKQYWGITKDICNKGFVGAHKIIKASPNFNRLPEYQKATYCWGAGYWISRDSMAIVSKSDEFEKSFLEDVCMGYVLNSVGIFPCAVDIKYTEKDRQ